jgi:hypothetical protein
MRRRAFVGAAAAMALAGAACTSVPVSTMWKLARFDASDLLAIDPAELRAAVLIDTRATMRQVTMAVALTPKDGAANTFEIPIAEPTARNAPLPPPPAGRRWEVFALNAAGQREFSRMRETALKMPRGSSMSLGLSAREGDVPPELMRKFPLRIEMMFDSKDGWFTLLKDTTLDLEAMAKKP